MDDIGITVFGIVYAMSTGAVMGYGYGLVHHHDVIGKAKTTALGGGIFMLGMYLAAPTWLRLVWM